jgi:hypothetical protein
MKWENRPARRLPEYANAADDSSGSGCSSGTTSLSYDWTLATHWECPCGDPPPPGSTTTPAGTKVSLREPWCPFCGGEYRHEYRRPVDEGDTS